MMSQRIYVESRADKYDYHQHQDRETRMKWYRKDCPHCNAAMSVESVMIKAENYIQTGQVCQRCFRTFKSGKRFMRLKAPSHE